MGLLTVFYSLFILKIVAAHTVFTTLSINDVNQGPGTCVRMPMTPNNATFPINDLDSNDMACGYDGTKGVARVCPAPQAAKLNFLFVEYPDNSQPGAIDPSHRGPCAVYMKRVDSPTTDNAVGDGWFKIWEDGYNTDTSQWCVDKLIQNNGTISINIPKDLAGGYYLVRPEVLALHQADKTPPNPQFYVGCAQIFLNSTSNTVPQDTVKIPGYTNIKDPSALYNIYTERGPYKTPGPDVYVAGSNATTKVDPVETQTTGLASPNTVVENANWWGVELDSYSTADGCANATKTCWSLANDCYNSAPPTGSRNCKIWEGKCTGIQDACNAGDNKGPPDSGKVLTQLEPQSLAQQRNTSPWSYSGYVYPVPPGVSSASVMSASSSVKPTSSSTTAPFSSTASASSVATSNSIEATSNTTEPASNSTVVDSHVRVTINGTCSGSFTCASQTEFGVCCSQYDFCGNTELHCGDGCQPDFGICGTIMNGTSANGTGANGTSANRLSLNGTNTNKLGLRYGWRRKKAPNF